MLKWNLTHTCITYILKSEHRLAQGDTDEELLNEPVLFSRYSQLFSESLHRGQVI